MSKQYSIKFLFSSLFIWLFMVCLLGGWWGRFVLTQASYIAEIEKKIGINEETVKYHWNKTQRMLYSESTVFFILLLLSGVGLFYLFWRDIKRARSISSFFATFTHELRTPLTSIRLQAESMVENLSENSENSKWLNRLLEDLLHLEIQIEKTLELARIEGGGSVFTQPIKLKPWLKNFLTTWDTKVQFESSIEESLIQADPMALKLILKNLFENSIKHSRCDPVKIQIFGAPDQGGVLLHVRDDGVGFSGEEKNLGQLFKKGALSVGVGVGLYLVRVLMKKMGGWARFSSKKIGFESTLWFPKGQQ